MYRYVIFSKKSYFHDSVPLRRWRNGCDNEKSECQMGVHSRLRRRRHRNRGKQSLFGPEEQTTDWCWRSVEKVLFLPVDAVMRFSRLWSSEHFSIARAICYTAVRGTALSTVAGNISTVVTCTHTQNHSIDIHNGWLEAAAVLHNLLTELSDIVEFITWHILFFYLITV